MSLFCIIDSFCSVFRRNLSEGSIMDWVNTSFLTTFYSWVSKNKFKWHSDIIAVRSYFFLLRDTLDKNVKLWSCENCANALTDSTIKFFTDFDYVDVGDEICWWHFKHVGDGFGHQRSLSFEINVGHQHSNNVTNIENQLLTLNHRHHL